MATSIMLWVYCSCGNRRYRWLFMQPTKREPPSAGSMTSLRFCGIEWRKTIPEFQTLSGTVAFRAIELPRSIAFQFRDDSSGETALFAPSVAELTDELRNAVHESDVVLFDGTFWSDGELAAIRQGARSARQMNHLPISDGSLDFLHQSPARRKIYTHINNTNPILMPSSRERAHVKQSGIEIARDGLEIVI